MADAVRRALVLASQTYGLQGCDADAELMRATLAARGFECDVRTGADATRAGMLDGFERLIAACRPGDAAVVYYSGHGGRVARPDAPERRADGRSGSFQFIVPFDIDDSSPEDFRGLLSEELTVLQARLTGAFAAQGAVPNVTTILDCCHSGYLARDPTLVPRFVDLEARMFPLLGIRVRAAATEPPGGLRTNPDAVRIVACQEEQSAFEKPSARGGHHGVLTDVLATLLDEVGDRTVSWTAVGEAVREAVQAVVPDQRPDVEGPAARRLFSVEEEPVAAPLRPPARRKVVVAAAGATGKAVRERLASSPLLEADDGAGPVLATVTTEGDGLVVRDDAGALMLTSPVAADEAGIARVVDVVATLANGRRVRELASGTGDAALGPDVELRFGTVAGGVTTPRGRHGERLRAGESVSLTLANLAAEPRYVWVFDVCVAGRVTLLTAGGPSGTLLEPAGRAGDVRAVFGAGGSPLFWPDDVPAVDESAGARPESFVVVVADARVDLSALGAAPVPTRDGDAAPAGLSTETALRYRVETVDFLLLPPA